MQTLRALAVKLPKYAWARFLQLTDLDLKLKSDLDAMDANDTYLDSYQYDANLADASALIDRCLAYRREYQELAASAILKANDFSLFGRQLEYSKAIEMADWVARGKRIELTGYQKTAAQFQALSRNTSLAAGFATQALGAANATEAALEGETARQALIDSRWKILEDNQKRLEDLYETKGSVLDYNDRAMRVRYLLRQDFIAATEKTLAAQRGIQLVFGLHSEFSWKDSVEPLDELVLVVRKLVRNVQNFTQMDTEFVALSEYVIDQKVQVKAASLGNITPLEPMKTLMASAAPLGNLRVKAIGARLRTRNWPDPANQNQQFIVANVSIRHKDGVSVALPHVGVVGPPDSGDFARSSLIVNRPPWAPGTQFNGSNWEFTLDGYNHPDNHTQMKDLGDLIHSIVFHFVIVGRVGTLEIKQPVQQEDSP